MSFRAIIAAAGLAVLAACADPTPRAPQISAPAGATAQQALNGFAVTVATADFIGTVCQRQGIRKAYTDQRTLVRDYTQTLISQGYSATELQAASSRLKNQNLGPRAIKYLTDRGARRGDLNSICAVGRNEIAQGTPVGRLLRRG